MKSIFLRSLSLHNFKGVLDLTIDFEQQTDIYGANESGKSTINTAFCWLLTGKDEFDRKDYEIKNTNRKELNTQAHEVEGVFEVDGRDIKLKRAYFENWEKPRGQSKKVFKGHYTDFYVNDVPTKPAEYQATVDDMISPQLVKLITNPTYFNSLHWEEQRRALIAIAGEITNEEVLNSIVTVKNKYESLINALNSGKSLEKWKAELSAKRTLLKKAAVEYAPRIDEAKRNMPEPQDWKTIEADIKQAELHVARIDSWLSDQSKALAEKQKGLMDKQKAIHQKQTTLGNIRFKIKQDLLLKQTEISNQVTLVQQQIRNTNLQLDTIQKTADNARKNKEAYQSRIEIKQQHVLNLRAEWDKINKENFSFDESKCECPTCKQLLPTDQVEHKKAELLKNFNEDVARRKADKVAQANQVKGEIKQLQDAIDAVHNCELQSPEAEKENLNALETKLFELRASYSKQSAENTDVAVDALLKVNADALNLQDEITMLQKDIDAGSDEEDVNVDAEKHKARKQEYLLQLDQLKHSLATREVIENTQKRIAQLEQEETANAQAIAAVEQQEFDIETFTRAKMDILEQKVNKLFRYVSFRLFQRQVNGEIAETCVCEYKGVPYPTLNTAAKLLAGIDILETLSNYYGIHAPVICDNRESVSWIPDIKSQVISLFVSPDDKKLRVETEKQFQIASI
jgi:DNA repair protein SbcC/Rad50